MTVNSQAYRMRYSLRAVPLAAVLMCGCSPDADPTGAGTPPGNTVLDTAAGNFTQFHCDDGPVLHVRFPGPETLEMTVSGKTLVLQRERSASGARYVGEKAEFWNKGQEATVRLDDLQFHCQSEHASR